MTDRPRSETLPFPIATASIARVEAWTVDQATAALAATSISSRSAADRRVSLAIDLDNAPNPTTATPLPRVPSEAVHTVYKRREPIRRDSLKRREALLKGKEGSRRRQRWENDRLLNNPHVEPPLPSDWQVQPTYPRHNVPYFLAPLWDAKFAKVSQERKARADAAKAAESQGDAEVRKVTQDLRAKLKKARGAKGLLQDLEQEVRRFVEQWEDKERELEAEGLVDATDSEDEEIVFVGRNGAMSDEYRSAQAQHKLGKDKLIFQSLVDDHGAAFGQVCVFLCSLHVVLTFAFRRRRYLVHSIGTYYGLKTWSVTRGHPARREAYVGLDVDPRTSRPSLGRHGLPRPLWAVV